jgi:hypothetical protein
MLVDDDESKKTLESFLSKRGTKNSKRGLLVVPNFSGSPVKQTEMEKQITAVYEYLKAFFTTALRPPGEFIFSETIYYDKDLRFIKAFRFDQRATLRTALLSHKFYLDCECAAETGMFDIGYAFKIFNEGGTQLNVFVRVLIVGL